MVGHLSLVLASMTLLSVAFGYRPDGMLNYEDRSYDLTATSEIIVTAENGDKLSSKENVSFKKGRASNNVILVRPERVKQTLHGIGTSFTESSAFVLSHLSVDKRQQVMESIYGEQGANFSMARTVIGATDFSVEGRWSYDDVREDTKREHFSIAPEHDGFS